MLDQPQSGAPDLLLRALRSPEADERIRALHQICPCSARWAVYERYMDEARILRKDPDPRVRRVALHLDKDAGEIEAMLMKLDIAEERGIRFGDRTFTDHWRRRQALYRQR